MANFQSVPRGDRISGQTLIATPPSITVGLWGYLASPGNELQVTSSDPAVRVTRGGIRGNVRLWVVTGASGQQTRLDAARLVATPGIPLKCTFAPAGMPPAELKCAQS
jgi:hypothetical protein